MLGYVLETGDFFPNKMMQRDHCGVFKRSWGRNIILLLTVQAEKYFCNDKLRAVNCIGV